MLVKRSSSWRTAIGCVPINPPLAASLRFVLPYVEKFMYIVLEVETEAGCEALVTAQLDKNSAGSCCLGALDGMWYHDSTATNWDAGLICRSGDEIKLTLHPHDQLIVEITRMSAGSPRNVLRVAQQITSGHLLVPRTHSSRCCLCSLAQCQVVLYPSVRFVFHIVTFLFCAPELSTRLDCVLTIQVLRRREYASLDLLRARKLSPTDLLAQP